MRIMRSVHSAEEVTGDKETPQTSRIRRQADSSTEGSNTAPGWQEVPRGLKADSSSAFQPYRIQPRFSEVQQPSLLHISP